MEGDAVEGPIDRVNREEVVQMVNEMPRTVTRIIGDDCC